MKKLILTCFSILSLFSCNINSCTPALILFRHFEDNNSSLDNFGVNHGHTWSKVLSNIDNFNHLVSKNSGVIDNICPITRVLALPGKSTDSADIIANALHLKVQTYTNFNSIGKLPNNASVLLFLNRQTLWSQAHDPLQPDPDSFLFRAIGGNKSSNYPLLQFSASPTFAHAYVFTGQKNDNSYNKVDIYYQTYQIDNFPPKCNLRIYQGSNINILNLTLIPAPEPKKYQNENWVQWVITHDKSGNFNNSPCSLCTNEGEKKSWLSCTKRNISEKK